MEGEASAGGAETKKAEGRAPLTLASPCRRRKPPTQLLGAAQPMGEQGYGVITAPAGPPVKATVCHCSNTAVRTGRSRSSSSFRITTTAYPDSVSK